VQVTSFEGHLASTGEILHLGKIAHHFVVVTEHALVLILEHL